MIGLGIGLGLFYLAFSGLKLEEIKDAFKEANYFWISLGMVIAIVSHIFRALRWQMLLKAAGHKTNSLNLFASIMVGYLVNQAIPRAGELSRATMTSRSERIPFSASFGTIVTDRIFDFLCLGLLVGTVFLLELDKLMLIVDEAFKNDDGAAADSGGIPWKFIILGVMLAGAVALYLLRKKLLATGPGQKIWNFVKDIFGAIKSVRKMRNAPLFIFYTVGIWLAYILMSWVCFFAFEGTSGLGFYFPLIAFVMGGIGMVIPSPGGIGSYHYGFALVFWAYAATIYPIMSQTMPGLENSPDAVMDVGVVLATIIHASQLLMMIVLGFLCWLYLAAKISRNPEPVAEKEAAKE